jgi:hypothetical protein
MKQWIFEERTGRIAVVILTLFLLWLRFPDFFSPSTTGVIEPYGDGIKAYTVIEYHAKYDKGFTWFEGMNYPYREHVVPAATQPLLSNTIKLISKVVDITPYTRVILHYSLLLGLLLCAFFLYLILRHFKLPTYLSIAVAIGLTFLSPQLHRMTAHYGLAHPEVLPIIMYLLLRLEEGRHWRTSLWIAVAVTAYSLIHFYYFAIIAFLISFYFLFGFIRKPSWPRLIRYAFHYSIQLLLPLCFFYFWMYYNDPVTDRTDQPWGFFHYVAIWEGIFTSMFQPFFQWVEEAIITIENTQFEGEAYVGLLAGLGSLVLLIRWIVSLFKKPIVQAGGTLKWYLNKMLWAALMLLFFSFCWPFSWEGWEWLLEYSGPIKQFRSVGRFSWAFYYIINIVVIVEIWGWLKDKSWKWWVLIPLLALLYYEAYNSCYASKIDIDQIRELKEGESYADIRDVNYDEFQALITVPYFNIGSDNFWYNGGGEIMPRSLILSMQTGLPTTSAMLTRTSLSQTMKQLELILEPYRKPQILDELPNGKPFLLMLGKYQFSQERTKYEHLLEGAQLIYENDSYQLYRVALDNFENSIESRKRKIHYVLRNDTLSLNDYGEFVSKDAELRFRYNSFDTLSADSTYMGTGALAVHTQKPQTIFEGTVPNQKGGKMYAFSFWMYLAQDLNPRSWVKLIEKDPETGEEISHVNHQVHRAVKALDNNGWGLVEFWYTPQKENARFQLVLKNEELKDGIIYLDELMIQPLASNIYKETPTYWFFNNRWYLK